MPFYIILFAYIIDCAVTCIRNCRFSYKQAI
jgi:hypothetical protein